MLRTKTQTTLVTVKSRLAQLLATENIKVQHLPVKTAYFDMQNRVLVCPIWKDMDGDLYDLCMGHEVGHALHTPSEGWHGALVQMGKGYQTYMNVVEDARIERKMKTKFPGLRAPFARAYIKLNDRDMFRIVEKKINVNKLGLIDRLNVYFKMGHIFDVHFTDEERVFIDRINAADTWEQVREIADELYARAKKNKDKLPETSQEGAPQSGEDSQEGDEQESKKSSKPKKSKEDMSDDASEENQREVPDPTSVTDEAFRQSEEQLVDGQATGIRTCYLPDTSNYKDMIVPIKHVYTCIEEGLREAFSNHDTIYQTQHSVDEFARISVQEIFANNKKYVDLLVKEFELRKNASDYARQLTAKTGELDVGKLHQYKFTNDLFRKVTTVQKGKNHGMVFFLDMSSSMNGIMGYTVKQLLVLVQFCKRVGIPFDVYGFADGSCRGFKAPSFKWGPDTIQCTNRNFHLKHLLSSSLRSNEFRRAYAAMAMYSNIFYGQQSKEVRTYLGEGAGAVSIGEDQINMNLSGTPYNKMLMASREIIEKFRMQHQVDIVNVVHLTDGDGTDRCHAPEPQVPYNDPNYSNLVNARIAYTDRKTHISHIAEGHQNSQEILTMMVKEITGCRHIAFYVGLDARFLRGYISRSFDDQEKKIAKESLDKHGFFRITTLGYDSYYYMAVGDGKDAKISDNEQVDISKRFIEAQWQKAKSRNMARQFAAELAEQVKHE